MAQPSSGGKKSRIVVDVAQIEAEARARRGGGGGVRGRRALPVATLLVIAAIVLVVLGGFMWWRSFKQGPSYSLALLVDAARRDDTQAVETLIDADRVAQGFVPQVIANLTGADSSVVPAQMRGRIAEVLPRLIPRVRESITSEVSEGLKGAASGVTGELPFPLMALGISRAAEVEERGDTADVLLRRDERTVALTMQRDGERWKVVSLKDERLAASLAARLAASLSGSSAPPQQPPQQRRDGGR